MPPPKRKPVEDVEPTTSEASVHGLHEIIRRLDQMEERQTIQLNKLQTKVENSETEHANHITMLETMISELLETVKQLSGSDNAGNKIETKQTVSTKQYIASEEWNECLVKRKQSFYKKIRSEGIAEIYRGFLKMQEPHIPKKFKEKEFPGITESHKKRIRNLEKTKLEIEIQRLEEMVSKEHHNLEEIERKINESLKEVNCPTQRQKRKEDWIKNVSDEENKSKDIWTKKKVFFENEEIQTSTDTRNSKEINKEYNHYYPQNRPKHTSNRKYQNYEQGYQNYNEQRYHRPRVQHNDKRYQDEQYDQGNHHPRGQYNEYNQNNHFLYQRSTKYNRR